MRKLVLGDGLLGSEIYRQSGWDYISRKKDKIDFREPDSYKNYLKKYDVIVNCIGHVDVYSDDKQAHWDINYKAVSDLVDLCNENNVRLVHISSDFVYSNSVENASESDVPVHNANWYGYTKLLGDAHVQLKSVDKCSIKQFQESDRLTELRKLFVIKNNFYWSDWSKLFLSLPTHPCATFPSIFSS